MTCLTRRKLTRKTLRIFGDVVGTSLAYAVLINLVVQISKEERKEECDGIFYPTLPCTLIPCIVAGESKSLLLLVGRGTIQFLA